MTDGNVQNVVEAGNRKSAHEYLGEALTAIQTIMALPDLLPAQATFLLGGMLSDFQNADQRLLSAGTRLHSLNEQIKKADEIPYEPRDLARLPETHVTWREQIATALQDLTAETPTEPQESTDEEKATAKEAPTFGPFAMYDPKADLHRYTAFLSELVKEGESGRGMRGATVAGAYAAEKRLMAFLEGTIRSMRELGEYEMVDPDKPQPADNLAVGVYRFLRLFNPNPKDLERHYQNKLNMLLDLLTRASARMYRGDDDEGATPGHGIQAQLIRVRSAMKRYVNG